MKILLVHNSYQERGGEDVVFEQERDLLQSAGHEVTQFRRSNDEVENYSGLQLFGRTIWSSETYREFTHLLEAAKPDLVHVHNTFVMISPSLYYACVRKRVAVVQTLHNYRLVCPAATFFRDGQVCEDCLEGGLWNSVRHACYRGSRLATAATASMLAAHRCARTFLDKVDAFVALTQFSRRKFVAGGMPAEKIFVKPNFVSPDPGEREGEGEYALFAGRLSAEKGILTLLAAWRELGGRIPLCVVGDVACGVPVLASRMGTMPEIVKEQHNGLLFEPGNGADLAAKVRQVWNDSAALHRMGKNARGDFLENYTAERNCRLLMDIYDRVVAARRELFREALLPDFVSTTSS